MRRVIVIGAISYNTMAYVADLPNGAATVIPDAINETVGSTGAGKALALSYLGFQCALYAALGNDENGSKVREYLKETQLEFHQFIDPAGTRRHVNLMDEKGERLSIFVEPGSSCLNINWEPVVERCRNADAVFLNIAPYCREVAPLLGALKTEVWCDLHDYDGKNSYHAAFLEACDIVQVSADKLKDPEAFIKTLVEDGGKRLAICTDAERGAIAYDAAGNFARTDVAPVTRRQDTNGAGDSFTAGFFLGWKNDLCLETCLNLGATAAAATVEAMEVASPTLSAANVLQRAKSVFKSKI